MALGAAMNDTAERAWRRGAMIATIGSRRVGSRSRCVLGSRRGQALATPKRGLGQAWQTCRRPMVVAEPGADTRAGMHGHPAVMLAEGYRAASIRGHLAAAAHKPHVAGMQVWNFADFAAVQRIMRVGGLNMKGVFTRTRAPARMAAHVLREFWSRS
jgi:beta-glucuronidase